ncbi:MAG: Two component regulator propeller [Pedosphaera sp.]|nr:Two component regulator propeller [Pedosphaera sp.]
MRFLMVTLFGLMVCGSPAAEFRPAPQHFRQEIASRFALNQPVQLIDCLPDGRVLALVEGAWLELREDVWRANPSLAQRQPDHFVFASPAGTAQEARVPWREIKQILRADGTNWLLTARSCVGIGPKGDISTVLPAGVTAQQLAWSPSGGLYLASSGGLLALADTGWEAVEVADAGGRSWARRDVLGAVFDSQGRLWFASKAGAGCRTAKGWRFYEGKDGLPWNDFTGMAPGPDGEVWFATHLGVIRFDGREWHYRQGRGWLPNDDVRQAVVDPKGDAWFATAGGVGRIARQPMTLAAKAEFYEKEIEQYIKRTPFGYVAEAALGKPMDKSSAAPQDSDNDGLWTAMYGAGECFAYAATKDAQAKARAKQAFEALAFLQQVTQGGEHAPDKGFVARTIRPVNWPDPNIGRLEADRATQKEDKLWKAYEPRWPNSADGKWYWKSDTSSDELDGHYFFYPLYYDFCAETEAERERVRTVVRDVTDHLLAHHYALVDLDGKPTRWAVYGPQQLNHDPQWWPERGLNSLSLLSYLAIAAHVTGDAKYAKASRELIDRHGYAHNAMLAKVQQGAGSGNQSDDEMAVMAYYGLLRTSTDEKLKELMRISFFFYWTHESQELNPFFNFAYAGLNLNQRAATQGTAFSLTPRPGWLEESMATLYGLPLDRLNWGHRNSHRLDIVGLPSGRAVDLTDPDAPRTRGYRVNDRVLPVENRQFNHWNTDPWRLDYSGNGDELAAGTVFLLPYYLGLYHGFIERPGK